MDYFKDLHSIYQRIHEIYHFQTHQEPTETWDKKLISWLDEIKCYIFNDIDWPPIISSAVTIIFLTFVCGIIRRMIEMAFVSAPETITETPILSTELSAKGSQISLELRELSEGKPLEISENIQGDWSKCNYSNYHKLYVVTVDMDASKSPSAEINEIIDNSLKQDSDMIIEARNVIDRIVSDVELSSRNSEENKTSVINIDRDKKGIFINELSNSQTETKTLKAGSRIPLRVGSRHRMHSN